MVTSGPRGRRQFKSSAEDENNREAGNRGLFLMTIKNLPDHLCFI